MRYCVSGRQPFSVMKKADEIKFNYNDKDRILDLVERFPEKTIILEVPGSESDWDLWKMYSDKFEEFYIALHDLSRVSEFNDADIKWYWPFPITSYYELGLIVKLNPSYLMIGAPLCFDLDLVSQKVYKKDSEINSIQIPLRMVVNVARPNYIPDVDFDGICGQWVRPEDASLYAERIRCFEFDNVGLKQEETYLHVYKDNGNWPGDLGILIQGLNYKVDNRAIPEEIGKTRMNCGQRCWETGSCHLCVSALKFANQIKKEKLARIQQSAIDKN